MGKTADKSRLYSRLAWTGERLLSGGFEGLEEISQGVISNQATGTENDWDALLWEGLVGTTMGLGGGAIGGGVNSVVERAWKAEQAENAAKAFEAVVDALSGTKTVQRFPEAAEDFARSVSEGKVEKVYVAGEALARYAQEAQETESIEAAMEKVGIPKGNREQFLEALEIGADVEIDAVSFAVKMAADPELYAQLRDHVKFDREGFTPAEAMEERERVKADADQLLQKYEEDVQKTFEEGGAAAALERDLKKQFTEAGRPDLFGRKGGMAGALIKLITARQIIKARQMGKNIDELLKPGSVRVERDGENVRIVIKQEGMEPVTLDELNGTYGHPVNPDVD
jgi:hypothetical protein